MPDITLLPTVYLEDYGVGPQTPPGINGAVLNRVLAEFHESGGGCVYLPPGHYDGVTFPPPHADMIGQPGERDNTVVRITSNPWRKEHHNLFMGVTL